MGGQGQLDFCLPGGQAGGQNKFEQKSRGSRQIIIFFSSLFRIIFFSGEGEGGSNEYIILLLLF